MTEPRTPSRVLVLGCGSVAQCLLPMLLDHFSLDPRSVTVVESRDNRDRVAGSLARGVAYERLEVTAENLTAVLGERLGPGDVLVDLAWNIDLTTLLEWCRDHGVRYLNTSVEVWDPYDDPAARTPQERTLYVRHMALRRQVARWGANDGPSAVVEHGANPGLVSHFTKQALVEVAARVMADPAQAPRQAAVGAALDAERYNDLAMALDVRVIHVAERDTQVTDIPKLPGEFVNTWSVDGFYEEGVAPAEMGWGTHERTLPPLAMLHAGEGPLNQICLARMAHKTLVRSTVPSGPIVGMVIRHGEAFTICDHLTVWDGARAAYRPTVHYAYCPADVAWASFVELEGNQYEYPRAPAHPQRRDHRGARRARRAGHGPPLQELVDRDADVHRRGPRGRAAPERDDRPGRRVDPGRARLDVPAPERGRARPGRAALARGPRRRRALRRHDVVGADRLGPGLDPRRLVRRVQRPDPRRRRPLAVLELPRALGAP